MRLLLLSLALLIFPALATKAAEPVQMDVVRTSPSSGFVLPRYGTINMEIAYHSAEPLRLQARAYSNGVSLDAGQAMNASVVHPAGSGKALVWVSYSEPTAIDAIWVTAYDESWKALAVLEVERPAQWLAKTADKRAETPAWVKTLIAKETALAEQYLKEHPPEPDSWSDALVSFMFISVPGYFILQAVAFFTLQGGWRWAALAPLLIMVPAVGHAVLALSAGSNLWPVVVIFAAPLGFLYLLLLSLLKGVRSTLSFA